MKRRRLAGSSLSRLREPRAGQCSYAVCKKLLHDSTGRHKSACTRQSLGDQHSTAGFTPHTSSLSSNRLLEASCSTCNGVSSWIDCPADVSSREGNSAAQHDSRASSEQTLMFLQKGQSAQQGGLSRPSHVQESHQGREGAKQLHSVTHAGTPLPWHGEILHSGGPVLPYMKHCACDYLANLWKPMAFSGCCNTT